MDEDLSHEIRTSLNEELVIGPKLLAVANVEKMMPRNYISKDGMGITERCRTYLLPLILNKSVEASAPAHAPCLRPVGKS